MFSLSSVTKNQIQKAVGLSMSQIFALDSASEKVFVETKNASPLVFSKNRVEKAYVVKDDIEAGYMNVIPLWQLGLSY